MVTASSYSIDQLRQLADTMREAKADYDRLAGVALHAAELLKEITEALARGDKVTGEEAEGMPAGTLLYDAAGDYWEKRPDGGWNCYVGDPFFEKDLPLERCYTVVKQG